ncbi:hypothetical protein [uncultured Rikenella sp.]|uniref:hypothetical protein n=1 Tax=uncultured Rikenella sp. TaxID=368003 RepID=UPI0025DD8417|nr:hypothetical protein [uncultured Rikenella sp.]
MQRSIGSEGTIWSSSVPGSSTGTWRLLFDMTYMYPSDASSRAHGFQLRCLSE